ncbi:MULTISPECIES: glutamate--cysteine ligase [unclassified Microbacterium]|uniref:carboxylate-amine ligase n=1 Tax=unclassified Microbacterium TaxID=2609290 RepID=UPI001DBCA969|nr:MULTISPECIES: glutamate--cysteine ligase [unclassified Microbacterium]CAH0123053.1 Putative glutamate--cysteine ligase 2 [Microbacterium sp. Bi121]HWK76244.1 glutamate--cysteine ligase [Microbacterium sp.]
MRTVGVEEELLLVDAESGRPRSVAARTLRYAAEIATPAESGGDSASVSSVEKRAETPQSDAGDDVPGGSLEHELQQQQIETDTVPHTDMVALGEGVRAWRDHAITAARRAGARVIASGTSPLPVGSAIVGKPRYLRMVEHFGLTTTEQLTGACHVHVSVESDDEGVGVLDRIRGWLSVLLALSANSPFWQGEDTKYASFRSQALVRWPTAGPTEAFGTAEGYRSTVAAMIASGAILDEGMVYFDARLSHHYPTVEIRVADVCADAADTVLIAALCRALVDTAAAEWRAGDEPSPVSVSMLRLMNWQAGRFGIEGDLIDPRTLKPRAAREIVAELVDHVRAALRENRDEALVDEQIELIFDRGNGAMRQRATLEKTGQLSDVVADLAAVTAGLEG